MKEVVKSKDLVRVCNSLIKAGLKIKVFGLAYPPYQEDIVFTDEKVNRTGFICTDSKVALDCHGAASKLKVRTLTGHTRFLTHKERDEYELNILPDNSWVCINPIDQDDISQGMLLVHNNRNLGMIIDLADSEEKNSIWITVVDENLNTVSYEIDLDKSRDEMEFMVLDKIIR